MKHLRKLSLLLAVMMLATTACGGDDSKDTDASDGTSTAPVSDSETASNEETLDIPADLKYNNTEINILTSENILASPDELTDEADLIQQALYKRTSAVEDRLDVDLVFTNVAVWQDTQNLVRQSVNAQSDDYDMAFTCASHQVNLVNEGVYLPISDLPYIDLEKPWWNKQYIDSVSLVADEPYILFGDITYNTIQRTTCVYFNIPLLEEKLNMKPEDLYEIVYDGEWTIDKFTELVSQVYEDDGNTINDAGDIHGLVVNYASAFDWLAYSAGVDFTSRDEDGYPTLNLNNETTIDLVQKLCDLHFNNQAVFNAKDNHGHIQNFADGKSLFIVNRVFISGWEFLRNMTDAYGILPMPKYDESIDGYHSTVETLVQWGGVPVTVADPTMISAVAEVLAYESRLTTTPAYYETSLKLKQTHDDTSIEMIELIMEGRDTDYLYINRLGGMGNIFTNVYNANQNTFASLYASSEPAALQALQNLIDAYEQSME